MSLKWKVRQVPRELMYRNRSQRRSPRMSRLNRGAPSLDTGIYLATSNTKLGPEPTLDIV